MDNDTWNKLGVIGTWVFGVIGVISIYYSAANNRTRFRSAFLGRLVIFFFLYIFPLIYIAALSIYRPFNKQYVLSMGFFFLWLSISISWTFTQWLLKKHDSLREEFTTRTRKT